MTVSTGLEQPCNITLPSLLQVVESLLQTCYDKLGTSSENTFEQNLWQLVCGLTTTYRFYVCTGESPLPPPPASTLLNRMCYSCREFLTIQIFPTYLILCSLMQLEGRDDLAEALVNHTVRRHDVGQGSCSALIKVLPKNEELLISQASWFFYSTMLRIYKLYELQLVNNSNPG